MKHIVRLSVVSALLLGTSVPAFSQLSNQQMGFSPATSGQGPSLQSAGGAAAANVQGTGGARTGGGAGNTSFETNAQAAQGDQAHTSWETSDRDFYGPGRNTNAYLPGTVLPYRPSARGQSMTRQAQYQQLTEGTPTSSPMLVAPMSTSRVRFDGPQDLGFNGRTGIGALTPYALRRGIITRATGTGSVDLSITSPDGKD